MEKAKISQYSPVNDVHFPLQFRHRVRLSGSLKAVMAGITFFRLKAAGPDATHLQMFNQQRGIRSYGRCALTVTQPGQLSPTYMRKVAPLESNTNAATAIPNLTAVRR